MTSSSGPPGGGLLRGTAVVYSPDGKLVASDQAGVIRIWDAASGQLLSARRGNFENFLRIGHALLAWILAWLGGRISGLLFVRSRMPTSEVTSRSTSASGEDADSGGGSE